MDEIVITSTNGQLTTSSLGIAEKFGKRHCDVIRDIENLIKEMSTQFCVAPLNESGIAEKSADQRFNETSAQNGGDPLFIETVYQHPQNRQWYKCYELTTDSFSLLVMEFTGRKALEWKLKYIEAFNLMEQKLRNSSAVNIEEIITKAVTAAVAETVKAVIPLMIVQSAQLEQLKRIRKKYRYTTPSKISTLPPELREQVDEMIMSGEYSCRQIANFIMNNSGIEILQMSVNRYRRNNFYEAEKSPAPNVEQVKEKWSHVSEAFCFDSETELTAVDKLGTYIMNFKG